NGAGLAARAAAADDDGHVNFPGILSDFQRQQGMRPHRRCENVFLELALVDGDLAVAVGEADLRHAAFAAAGASISTDRCFCHDEKSFLRKRYSFTASGCWAACGCVAP